MIAAEYWRPLRLPWGEIPQYPHVELTPKMAHERVIQWHTSGFC